MLHKCCYASAAGLRRLAPAGTSGMSGHRCTAALVCCGRGKFYTSAPAGPERIDSASAQQCGSRQSRHASAHRALHLRGHGSVAIHGGKRQRGRSGTWQNRPRRDTFDSQREAGSSSPPGGLSAAHLVVACRQRLPAAGHAAAHGLRLQRQRQDGPGEGLACERRHVAARVLPLAAGAGHAGRRLAAA